MDSVVSDIKKKVQALGSQNVDLSLRVEKLSEENIRLKQQITLHQQELKEAGEKYNVLKMAKSLNGSEEDTSDTKKKIGELVREIDKCIALLNK